MMNFLKLLAVALLAIHLNCAAEPADAGSPGNWPLIDGSVEWASAQERHPGSVLDSAAGGTHYRFSLASEPRPANWSLLLGALLSIGFIVRRRLAFD